MRTIESPKDGPATAADTNTLPGALEATSGPPRLPPGVICRLVSAAGSHGGYLYAGDPAPRFAPMDLDRIREGAHQWTREQRERQEKARNEAKK